MTATEFNTKYDAYIERREYVNREGAIIVQKFGGLEFDVPEVTNYLGGVFEDLTRIPGFTFSQIKLKFNSARFYTNLKSAALMYAVESEINRLVKQFDKQQEDV